MKALQSKKEKKYKEIIAAAQKVFSEKGFHKATVDEIAELAQVAKGTVYLYFPDKRALFEHILQELSDEYQEASEKVLEMQDSLQALRSYIETRLKVYSENAKLVRIHLLSEIVDEETKNSVLNMHRHHIEIAQQIISKGIETGYFVCDDIFSAALAINGIINQFALYHIISGNPMDKEKITSAIMQLFLSGIKK